MAGWAGTGTLGWFWGPGVIWEPHRHQPEVLHDPQMAVALTLVLWVVPMQH